MCQKRDFTLATSVATLLLLRFIQKAMEYQFIVLGGADKTANQTNYSGNASGYWDIKYEGHGTKTMATVTSWMYTCRHLLPVFGGLLACWMGHVRALQLSGLVMLVSTAFMSAAVNHGRWRGDSGVAMVACLLMLVYSGLIIPNVMLGVLMKRTQTRHRTVLCALIYMSSAAGLYAGVEISRLPHLIGRQYGLVCVAMAITHCLVAMLVLPWTDLISAAGDGNSISLARVFFSTLLHPCHRAQLPTYSRLKRSCLVFATVLPFLFSVCGDRSSVFKAEKQFLRSLMKNGSFGESSVKAGDGGSGARNTTTSVILAAGLVAANLVLAITACLMPQPNQRLPIRPRLILGLCLQAALELSLSVVSSGSAAVRFDSPSALDTFYAVASGVDALSAALVMVAAYEILDQFERDLARPLIVGVMLTVWGIGQVASRLLVMACQRSVYHVTLLLLLAASVLYCRFFAFPLANTLIVNYESMEPDEVELLETCKRLINDDEDRENKPLLHSGARSP